MLTIHVPEGATFIARGVRFDAPIEVRGPGAIVFEDCVFVSSVPRYIDNLELAD